MASIINSTTTAGVTVTGDNSGSLQLATNNGTTAVTIDTSQRAAFVAGTAALPAITTTGDTNTGIFFPAADTIAFTEGGVESMRIDSSGNVGIGRTPDQRFQIAAPTAVQSDMFVGSTRTLTFYADATQTIISAPTAIPMAFRTSDTERMRITSGGALCVGTTSATGAVRFIVESDTTTLNPMTVSNTRSTAATDYAIIFYRAGNIVGSVQTSLSATSYVTSSDYRLKENIAPMQGALATVAQLKPVTYKWKSDGSDGQGFIAHELQAIVPDCVTGEKDAVETYTDEDGNEQTRIKPQGVDTSFLVATLTAAIQELKAELDATKAEIQALKGTL